jgi:hypothetical protein
MPPKTVLCCICKATVSKRSTLSLGDKRACRTHDEVKAFLDDKDREEEERKRWAEVDHKMRVISISSGVRMMHTLQGIPVELLYLRVRQVHGKEMEAEIRETVAERGGPVVGHEELMQAALMGAALNKRRTDDGRTDKPDD